MIRHTTILNRIASWRFPLALALALAMSGCGDGNGSPTVAPVRQQTPPKPETTQKPKPRADFNGVQERESLFRVVLWRAGVPATPVVIEGSASGRYDGTEITVTTHDSTAERRWELAVTPAPGLGVFEVEFPRLYLHPIAGAARDRLIVPWQSGLVIENPLGKEPHAIGAPHHIGNHIWYGSYGSAYQALQCLLYEDGSKGAMLWTQDPGLMIKDFEVSRIDGADGTPCLVASVHHYPGNTGKPGAAWTSPYPVVLSTYEHGWQEAAERYRAWAWQQPWCAGGGIVARIRSGDLPAWFLNSPMWTVIANAGNLWMMEKLRDLLPGVEQSVFLTKWQRHGFDELIPEYFPPNDEAGYRKMIAVQKTGLHLFPYINCLLKDDLKDWTQDPDTAFFPSAMAAKPPALIAPQWAHEYGSYVQYKEFWGVDHETTDATQNALRTAWSGPVDETILGRILSGDFTEYPYRRDGLAKELRDGWGKDPKVIGTVVSKRPFSPMCRSDRRWQDFMNGLATRNLQEYGTDGQYLDELSVGSLWACWADDHGHASGLGSAYLQGARDLVAGIHKRNPGKVLAGECMGEWAIGSVEDAHCMYPTFYDNPGQVPLFQQVYHGHFSHMGWPLSIHAFANPVDLASELHCLLHHGFKAGFAHIEVYLKMIEPTQAETGLPIMKSAIMALLATADASVYGQRLADPVVSGSPQHTFRRFSPNFGDPAFKEVSLAVVEASQWRSLDGAHRVLLLSNSGETPQKVQIFCPGLAEGSVLRDTASNERITYTRTGDITLKPLRLVAYAVEDKPSR